MHPDDGSLVSLTTLPKESAAITQPKELECELCHKKAMMLLNVEMWEN